MESTRAVHEGDVLWTPPADARETSEIGRFLDWLRDERGRDFPDYDALFAWSISDLEGFWGAIWDFFGVRASAAPTCVLEERIMPGATWFPGARLNYAEHLMGRDEDTDRVAILGRSQTRPPVELTYGELRDQVARARAGLKRLGVGPGDRVVAYLPNIPETLIAYAATASLGAIWASCAPEFGVRSAIDRFAQVEPKVLLAIGGYQYGAKHVDRRDEVAAIRELLPSLEHVVHVPYGPNELPDALGWDDLMRETGPLEFEQVAFDHPLCVLFSSGTTGLPKAIVHGHGGILVEHYKNEGLCWDLKPGDRLCWFSTTGWMMWNTLVSGLLLRASIVMVDGNPAHPDLANLWRLAEETRATHFGAAPAYIMGCRKAGLEPGRDFDLSNVRQVIAAGSPLPTEGFAWIYEQLGPDVLLNIGTGGTDVCSGIAGGGPLQPVYAGELAGRYLGVATDAYDERGQPVVDELGELVITEPMPSMPVRFWNDPGDERYRATYFEMYPGVWRHGDWIRFTERGSSVLTGRSDATLNRGGVRLGTSELYSVVEDVDAIADSLVIHLEDPEGGLGELILFVVPAAGVEIDDAMRADLARTIRTSLSPRHVPDRIEVVPAVPRTLTGKKLEVPVKRILQGADPATVANRDSLADPTALESFVALAGER